ncbi:MAG: hypothetical protein ABW192_01460, partial [Sphingobium sp.]
IWLGQYVAIPVEAKAAAVMVLGLALSYGVWLVVERSPLLSFLFNGIAFKSRLRAPHIAPRLSTEG